MKYIYLTLALIFSLDSFGQNDILGEWNLYYIEVNGIQQYSTVPNLSQTISFYSDNSLNGGGCNTAFTGSFVQNSENSLYFTPLGFLGTSCIYPFESNLYINPYYSLLSSSGPDEAFNFSISEEGLNETLTIMNIQRSMVVSLYQKIICPAFGIYRLSQKIMLLMSTFISQHSILILP